MLGENLPFESHYENLMKAREWGFKVPAYIRKCQNLEEVFGFIDYWDKERKKLPFDIDGIVIKSKFYVHQRILGLLPNNRDGQWHISLRQNRLLHDCFLLISRWDEQVQ